MAAAWAPFFIITFSEQSNKKVHHQGPLRHKGTIHLRSSAKFLHKMLDYVGFVYTYLSLL